jgi:hypothetical protein
MMANADCQIARVAARASSAGRHRPQPGGAHCASLYLETTLPLSIVLFLLNY